VNIPTKKQQSWIYDIIRGIITIRIKDHLRKELGKAYGSQVGEDNRYQNPPRKINN
jgi:hypothetical protein